MVDRIPSGLDWVQAESTLVEAAAYDEAAERIFLRRRDGETVVFESCKPRDWDLFLVPGTSPGQYLTRNLQKHPYSIVPRGHRHP